MISKFKKKPGPAPTGKGKPVLVRLHPPELSALDAFVAGHDEDLTRPQAIRDILADWLSTHGFMKRRGHNHPEPNGSATEAVRAMDTAIKEHKRARKTRTNAAD